jgi:hypothetical protein
MPDLNKIIERNKRGWRRKKKRDGRRISDLKTWCPTLSFSGTALYTPT